MAVGSPFSPTHVSSFAARAAELERIGEARQDPHTLIRAARLYTLAVRIADDIDDRPAPPFTAADLARVRDELRALITDAAASGRLGDSLTSASVADESGDVMRAFREVAARIEQRMSGSDRQPLTDARPEA